jgi:peptidoglycan/LPS O-acetylase OafA/YrhL
MADDVDMTAAAVRAGTLGYRPELDGLRALAAGSVVLAHAHLFERFGVGVDVFFALSGYLITRILLDEWRQRGTVDLLRFWKRRACRLVPALVVVVAVCSAVGMAGNMAVPSLLYFSNWQRAAGEGFGPLGHTWSLSIEEQFYLLWPVVLVVLLRFGGTRRALRVALGLAVAVIVLRELAAGRLPEARIYNGSDFRADGLLLGCALALWGGSVRAWWTVGAWVLVVAGVGPHHATVAVATCCLIAAPGVAAGPLSNGVLRWFGQRAYGIYLWHYPLCRLLLDNDQSLWRVAVMVALTVALAVVSYRWVEQPILRWSRRQEIFVAQNDAYTEFPEPPRTTREAPASVFCTTNST